MDMVGVGIVEFVVVMVFAVAVPLFLLFFVIKWAVASAMKGANSSGSGSRTAKDILDERCARGEVSREEYEGMRRDIEG